MRVQFLNTKKETYTTERHGPYPRKSVSEERSIGWVSYQSTKRTQREGDPKPNSNDCYISIWRNIQKTRPIYPTSLGSLDRTAKTGAVSERTTVYIKVMRGLTIKHGTYQHQTRIHRGWQKQSYQQQFLRQSLQKWVPRKIARREFQHCKRQNNQLTCSEWSVQQVQTHSESQPVSRWWDWNDSREGRQTQ